MKILAVIPARAGSKGIPNKNIRIINGKPLIAYCIENALSSRYITDIIVTTDSPEIELIAKYYGVKCKHRSEELCGDAVTLDSVIYDVCKNIDCDYVVTLQPTSPTLKVATLDSAICFAKESQKDTVISTVNKPHLAWVEKSGEVIPAYVQRLNRQYLPKHYLETGAFVISKRNIVTEDSRIGKDIGVYEISEEEAVDVDGFLDLLCIEHILRERRTAIIVNGNNQIGMGHICRMLELADTLYQKPTIYYDARVTKREAFGNTTHNIIGYRDDDELRKSLRQGDYQLLINDVLDTHKEYMDGIIEACPNAKIVNFEDLGEGRKQADMVLNALYCGEHKENNEFTGENYYLAPKMFLLYKPIDIKDTVKKILVCFGGADPQGYTEKVIQIIERRKYKGISFTIVLGRAKKNVEQLINNTNLENVEILYDIKDMPEIMSKSDLAVTSRGRTCFELALLGIPTITMSQNAREEKHEFACEENGFLYLGNEVKETQIEEALDRMLSMNQETRMEMQRRMLHHDLRDGRERIKNLIDSL